MATKIELEEMLFKLQCDQMESNKTRKKIEIQNLSALEVSFYPETLKDENSLKGILLNPFESSKKFDYAEIEAQIRANNILFVGRDGKGKNATIRICDFEMYKDLFDLPDATEYPAQLTKDAIEMLIAENDKQTFKEKLEEYIVTKNEAVTFVNYLTNEDIMDEVTGWKKNMILKRYKEILWK